MKLIPGEFNPHQLIVEGHDADDVSQLDCPLLEAHPDTTTVGHCRMNTFDRLKPGNTDQLTHHRLFDAPRLRERGFGLGEDLELRGRLPGGFDPARLLAELDELADGEA